MNIILVGLGKLGFRLAEILTNAGHSVTVVDQKEELLQRAASRLDVLPVHGNGANLELLEGLFSNKVHLLAAVTSSDETNILICQMAKNLSCPRVIARVRNPEYASQMGFFKEKLQIDFITNPDLDLALDISRYVLRGYTNHMESFAEGRVVLFDVPMQALPQLAGLQLREIDLFENILVAALFRDGHVVVPSGNTRLKEQDILYLVGRRETVTAFTRTLPSLKERRTTKNVILLRGGRAAFYLAQRLLTSGVAVKIIEQDQIRCDFLAENLRGALVICGDATDFELLQDEGLSDTDALVSLTGNDEENLVLALLGKEQGVPKVVAKVSRSNFVPIIEQLGIDRAVSPVLISAAEIVRFMQGGQMASLSLLFGGQAEVVEILVPDDAIIVGKKLAKAKIPQGLIIGAVVRDNQVFIPQGNSTLKAQDRVIVFCLQAELPALQHLFSARKRGFWHELWPSNSGSGKSSTD